MAQGKYSMVSTNLGGAVEVLQPTRYLPTILPSLQSRQAFSQLTHVIDSLNVQRLVTLHHVQSTFLSALTEETRFSLKTDHHKIADQIGNLTIKGQQIKKTLQNFVHEPELIAVYCLQGTSMCLIILLSFLVIWLWYLVT